MGAILNLTLPETEKTPRVSLDLDTDDVLSIDYQPDGTVIKTTKGPFVVMELQADLELQYAQTGAPPPDGKDRKFDAIGVTADTPIATGLADQSIDSVIGLIDKALSSDDAFTKIAANLGLKLVDFVRLIMKSYKVTDYLPPAVDPVVPIDPGGTIDPVVPIDPGVIVDPGVKPK